MLKNKTIATLAMTLFSCFCLMAQEQPKQPDPEEIAEKEAERLEGILKLEDWQVFYVDSTLRYDLTQMYAEIEKLSRSRVSNVDLYFDVQDKWTERTQEMYKKIFTPEQWDVYLKSGGGARLIKDREKRRAKKEGKK